MSARPAWRRLSLSLMSCHLSGNSVADKEAVTRELTASSAAASLPCSSSSASWLPAAAVASSPASPILQNCLSQPQQHRSTTSSQNKGSSSHHMCWDSCCPGIELSKEGRGRREAGGSSGAGSVITVTARWC
uniref:Uncharacterized protein n=1 Tax=Arundo donax TaxID=35708 RepID=A0A0A9FAQ4_ARUDO